ncbi:hypothetical protein M2352_001729 [Azospirillum fermentarium]|uniref:hypothetical protein n=1 Tax=Azospirillum fermentarium TaxID=1233114 RepID=UPI002226E822|nr:hypothetical protein [Azospirillum fermentarium]MCW2246138.1 hypothetical protein [Azospirillum fermentarium]
MRSCLCNDGPSRAGYEGWSVMLFDFEPSGVNDTYLRLSRRDVSCILVPCDCWNGLLRLNYLTAGGGTGNDPYIIFRALDVGWDDGRFFWKGKAHPVSASGSMAVVFAERGLIAERESEALLFGIVSAGGSDTRDETLLLRALMGGATVTPIYDDTPLRDGPRRAVTGFAIRTLSESAVYTVECRNGLPVLNDRVRGALQRQIG